ncbi:hypothetical protein EFN20_01610 [Propionibacterium freudenreichii]|uniref:Uncharacterized protein n=2 Tax=Propionibacterium freudenreichii TaxID=1744 RepID=D7GEW7_PROFC|nr:hypothetical protein [Propionibacterium freudenreichii]MDN6798265.1 hypothetical protein [Propionibacterium sp.]ARO12311.1 hypothetical protein BMR99_07245 [Propionibacterium freudenreichii]AWY95402.1 Hypothetical protein CB129slpB_0689 [Propionibacterium freudenreichii]MCQ1997432.1 hypothetical protein [Propionibacterium freudenreichii]MCT2976638.1 hypothetical protein [Propionibacterium freudenreichii]
MTDIANPKPPHLHLVGCGATAPVAPGDAPAGFDAPAGLDSPEASTGWVDAAPFRAMAHRLMAETGWHWRVLALATDVPAGTMRALLGLGRAARHEHPRIRRSDALSLWERDAGYLLARAARPELARTTRICLRVLIARGHTVRTISTMTALPVHLVIELASGRRRHCTAMTTWRCRAAMQSHAEKLRAGQARRRRDAAQPALMTAPEGPDQASIAPAPARAA